MGVTNPRWQSLSGFHGLMDWFKNNPVFYSVVMIKAREAANMRIKVCNRVTGEDEPVGTTKPIPAKLYALFNKPNCLQSRGEFFQQRKVFREVCGNSFVYGNFGLGLQKNPLTCSSLMNVWPQYMNFKLKGKYFSATDINEIIEGWMFKMQTTSGTYKEDWTPDEILHSNAPNLDPRDGLIFGSATALSLIRPLSNIDMAYESRNVIMQNRGMMAIATSGKEDASGRIPLNEADKEILEREYKKHGLLEGQKQIWFSSVPMDVTAINQDVRRLGLFDEIATDGMLVCNAFGVPEILLKLYLQGATFENQEASLRRLYQGTLIPEMEDDMVSFNSFLGLDGTEWSIEGDFSHVACLQEDRKRDSETNNTTSTYMEKMFLRGMVTQNQWITSVGLPSLGDEGDKYIWGFSEEQLAIILGKPVTTEPTEPITDPNQKVRRNGVEHLVLN